MSIHRDPRIKHSVWYAYYTLRDGRRICRSTGKRKKAEALIVAQVLEQIEREAMRGPLGDGRLTELFNETRRRLGHTIVAQVTVKTWLEEWLAGKDGKVAAASKSVYRQAVHEFLDHLGPAAAASRLLESITPHDIELFLGRLSKEGRAPRTVNKLRSILSIPFERALKLGKIRINPVKGTARERTTAVPKDTFSGSQISAILRVASDDWAGATLFAYGCGARLGDVAALRWSSLDVTNGIVIFREQKTAHETVTALHGDFLDWLAGRPVPSDPDAPVFPELSGKPLAGDAGLSNQFIALVDRAGIPQRFLRPPGAGKSRQVRALTFHSLRHTCASAVHNAASVRESVRRVTGHAEHGSLDTYLHRDIAALKAAVQLIPRLPK